MERICPRLRVLWRGSWGAGTTEPARYLHDHELVLVTKGSCGVEMDGSRLSLTPGDYLIIPPNHCHTTICQRSVFRTCIHFDWLPRPGPARKLIWSYAPRRPSGKDIAAAPRFVPQSVYQGRFSLGGPVPGLLETIFYRWQSRTPHGVATARAGFLELLAHLILHQKNPDAPTPAQTHFQLARSVKSLLDSNIPTGSGIQELLGSLGFSYAHLCRIFHAAFGLTPVEYRNAARLEQAKTLLRDTSLTIAEVAYRVGFQDPAYFTRQFRKRNNLGPRNFRIRLRGAAGFQEVRK